VTGSGTYGWVSHARDVLGVADALGAVRLALLRETVGAFVAMEIAHSPPDRLSAAVLIDACGAPDPAAVPLIRAAVERLGAVYPSLEAYLTPVQRLRKIRPWSPRWERYFRYELVPVEGGVRARSDRDAVLEDVTYGEAHDPRGPVAVPHHARPPAERDPAARRGRRLHRAYRAE
jgi:pimeloyl-ACP methyl ester carboxylesterase